MPTQKPSSNRVILDSNFLVALIDKKDKWHSRAKNISEKLDEIEHTEVILDLVVNETISVIAKRVEERGDEDFANILKEIEKKIPKNRIVWAYPRIIEHYDSIMDVVRKHGGKLNFHDVMIFTVIRVLGSKYIVSFDKDFDSLEDIKRIDSETVDDLL